MRFSPFAVCLEIFQRFEVAKGAFLWCLRLLHFALTKEKNRKKGGIFSNVSHSLSEFLNQRNNELLHEGTVDGSKALPSISWSPALL